MTIKHKKTLVRTNKLKKERLYNPIDGFNFEHLDDPNFKEDSVREELITPILKAMGYGLDKPNQIVRSKALLHPFVSIGSQSKKISIIPDYLLIVDDKPAWILDAKSPSEKISKSKHVEQAYSYAMHPDVRCNFYALCNGKEFAIYSIFKSEPILHFPLYSLPVYWENLMKYIAPKNVFNEQPFKLSKDLGLHLKRLGFENYENMIFPDVPITSIGQLDNEKFSISGCVVTEYDKYVVTFDFGMDEFEQLKKFIPEKAANILSNRGPQRNLVQFGDAVFKVSIHSRLGKNLEENNDEIFLPLHVNEFK